MSKEITKKYNERIDDLNADICCFAECIDVEALLMSLVDLQQFRTHYFKHKFINDFNECKFEDFKDADEYYNSLREDSLIDAIKEFINNEDNYKSLKEFERSNLIEVDKEDIYVEDVD